jgi:hypothetical protein
LVRRIYLEHDRKKLVAELLLVNPVSTRPFPMNLLDNKLDDCSASPPTPETNSVNKPNSLVCSELLVENSLGGSQLPQKLVPCSNANRLALTRMNDAAAAGIAARMENTQIE